MPKKDTASLPFWSEAAILKSLRPFPGVLQRLASFTDFVRLNSNYVYDTNVRETSYFFCLFQHRLTAKHGDNVRKHNT